MFVKKAGGSETIRYLADTHTTKINELGIDVLPSFSFCLLSPFVGVATAWRRLISCNTHSIGLTTTMGGWGRFGRGGGVVEEESGRVVGAR